MPIITITRKDLSKFKPVKPGWYRLKTIEIGDGKPAKAQGSDSVVYETRFEIVGPHDSGVEVTEWFNTGGLFRIAQFVAAVEKVKPEELFANAEAEKADIDMSATLDREFDGEIVNEVYNGNIMNKIKSFAPAGTAPF